VSIKTLPSRVQMVQPRLSTIQPGSWRADKRSSTQRGYDYRWQQERKRYLDANPLCVMCQAEGRVEAATVVDHRVPHRGDMVLFWDRTNWDSLCTTHHNADKQRQEARDTVSGATEGRNTIASHSTIRNDSMRHTECDRDVSIHAATVDQNGGGVESLDPPAV